MIFRMSDVQVTTPSLGNSNGDVHSDKVVVGTRNSTRSIRSVAQARKNSKVKIDVTQSAKSPDADQNKSSDSKQDTTTSPESRIEGDESGSSKVKDTPKSSGQTDTKLLDDSQSSDSDIKDKLNKDTQNNDHVDIKDDGVQNGHPDKDNVRIDDSGGVDGNNDLISPTSRTPGAGGYSDEEFDSSDHEQVDPSVTDKEHDVIKPHNTGDSDNNDDTNVNSVTTESAQNDVDKSEAELCDDTQMKGKEKAVEDDTASITSSVKRNSTFVKPESSFIDKTDAKKDNDRKENVFGDDNSDNINTSQTKEAKPSEQSGSDKQGSMSFDPSQKSSYDDINQAWSDKDNGSGGTIEDVASNFMNRVQKTEEDNAKLLDDNQRLLGKIKIADENEHKLVNEIHVLKGEQADLTGEHNNVKDENSVLLKRIADANREKEAQRKVYVEENAFLRSEIKVCLQTHKGLFNNMKSECLL